MVYLVLVFSRITINSIPSYCFKTVLLLTYLLLSGCFLAIPTGDHETVRVSKQLQAYDRQWFSYTHVVRRDYFTFDSDLFKYLTYDWYIEAKGGDFKTLISDSIYVLQQDGGFKQYIPEPGPSGHISVYDSDNKIYLVLKMEKELVTDCLGYHSDAFDFQKRGQVIHFVGEYDLKTKRFNLTHFMPRNSRFEYALRDGGARRLDIIRVLLSKALPLICSEDVTAEQLRKQYDALWE